MTQALRAMARAVVQLYGRDPVRIAEARKQIEAVRDAVNEDAREAADLLSAAETSAMTADLFTDGRTH